MMSDLMREEFEVWQAKETPGADLDHCGELIGSGPSRVSYRNMYVAERWIGWQASRESLVIELPADAHLSRDGLDEHYQAGHMRDQIVEAIHAAGVKTK